MIEKTFPTPCGTIHYWTNDISPERITLVFLPGLTADHRLFDMQIDAFQNQYNVLVWDAPGHGASRPFRLAFSLEDKARFLHDILERENIVRPVLVGQSMGGYVSQCYIDLFPGSVSGFVCMDSAPLKREYLTSAELWMLKHTEPMYRAFPWKLLVWCGVRGCAVSDYGQQLMAAMMGTFAQKEYCALAGHGFRILAEAIEKQRAYDIDCPALLICGRQDRAGSSQRYNRIWAKTTGLPLIWVDQAGHNSNTDQPEAINQMIRDFITEHIIDKQGENNGL